MVVVLPASMWAMMPMFLQRSNGTVLGTTFYSFFPGSSFRLDLVIGDLKPKTEAPFKLPNYPITQLVNPYDL